MILKVAIYTVADGRDQHAGEVIFDGKNITTQPTRDRWCVLLENIARDTIRVWVTGGVWLQIDPAKKPEQFVRSLYLVYKMPYVRALQAVEC